MEEKLMMFNDKAYHVKAKNKNGEWIQGAVHSFFNEKNSEVIYLMLHADANNRKPMISKIDIATAEDL